MRRTVLMLSIIMITAIAEVVVWHVFNPNIVPPLVGGIGFAGGMFFTALVLKRA